MHIARQYTKFCWLLLLGVVLSACNQNESPRNNQITVTPSTTIPQNEKAAQLGVDKSPMDMIYYPVDYPKLKMSGNLSEPLVARAIYSRPQRDSRTIFGNLVKYGSLWRLGANEATEIEFFKDVIINNQKVSKGRYVLYCIPYEKSWTLVLNHDLFTWGLKIDSTKDAYKFSIPVDKTRFPYEVFTMEFEKADKNMQLVMKWDSVRAILPIKY